MRVIKLPFTVILLFLIKGMAMAQQTVEVDAGQAVQLGKQLEFFIDSTGSVDITKAIQAKYQPYNHAILNLGNSPFNVWTRVSLRTNTEENVYLEIDNALMEHLELYETGTTGVNQLFEGGFRKPFYSRPIPAENFLFSIDMQKGVAKTFYIKANSGFPLLLPMTVSSKEKFTTRNQQHNVFWGLYIGVIIFAFLYNLFIYFSVREKTYLLYILYILGSSTFYLGLQGFAFKYYWPNLPGLNAQLPVLICVTNIIITLFTMKFLQITKKKKGLYYFGNGLIIAYILIALLNIVYSYAIAAGLAQMLSLITCIYFIYAAIRRYRQGVRTAKYYLIGWTFFLVMVMIYIFTINNALPGNFFTTHSIFIGHMTEVLLLSFALADRINLLKKENELKQKQIIHQLEENEKLQLKVNRELEQKVKERTIEVVEQKNEAERQRARSDELLLNILPAETAEELKANGSAKAKHINEVTVLFSDIKNFTTLTEHLSPAELVADINECFSAFDRIMGKLGVEKIKTIGDAYMAAGGLPNPTESHAHDVVAAGLEIQQFMKEFCERRRAENKVPFEIRVGVHTGPVVAGIVGIKKFAYDIWGDTVNLACRMEQCSEAGKVNISETTYHLIKNKFQCVHRGKLEAKHKGLLDMYFVENRL